MTTPERTYWVRMKNSIGVGQPHGRLLGRDHRGRSFMTIKPGAAIPVVGGEKLDHFLEQHPDMEAIEVVTQGTEKYHGRVQTKWRPA